MRADIPALIAAALLVAAAVGAAQPARAGSGATFLALGDSYTIGEGVPPAERWPVRLAAALRERGHHVEDPVIIATTGWTTLELAAGIDRAAPEVPVDLVTLMVGVNDQYRGGSPEEFRPRFVALLERAIGYTGAVPGRVVVLSIPDWGVTPFAARMGRDREEVARSVDAFNAVCREEAKRAGARFVDVTPVSREAASDHSLLTIDGLHPSPGMYQRWVDLVLPEAEAALRGE